MAAQDRIRHDEETRNYHEALKSGLIQQQAKIHKSKGASPASAYLPAQHLKKGMASVKNVIPSLNGLDGINN